MVEEELDETSHWLTLILRSDMMKASRVQPLHQECCELLSIIVKSIVTTKSRMKAEEIEKTRNNRQDE